jgi:hypothetical protein
MTELTIAVTALNAIDSPSPGVGVIRALRDEPNWRVRIIGLSYESLEPGIYMHDLVDKTYQIPYPTAGSEQFKARLAYIHEQEKLDVITPTFDYPMVVKQFRTYPLVLLQGLRKVRAAAADHGKRPGADRPHVDFGPGRAGTFGVGPGRPGWREPLMAPARRFFFDQRRMRCRPNE